MSAPKQIEKVQKDLEELKETISGLMSRMGRQAPVGQGSPATSNSGASGPDQNITTQIGLNTPAANGIGQPATDKDLPGITIGPIRLSVKQMWAISTAAAAIISFSGGAIITYNGLKSQVEDIATRQVE